MALKPNALLINFAVFDANGKMTAKLVDSTLMFNERRAYEVTRAPTSVTLTHLDSKNVVLQMEVKKPDVVAFTRGADFIPSRAICSKCPRRSGRWTSSVRAGPRRTQRVVR